jgi:hypothetical protein
MKFGINDISLLISHINSPNVKSLQIYEVEMTISHPIQDPEMLFNIKTSMLRASPFMTITCRKRNKMAARK